jgi:hypothetical protein
MEGEAAMVKKEVKVRLAPGASQQKLAGDLEPARELDANLAEALNNLVER